MLVHSYHARDSPLMTGGEVGRGTGARHLSLRQEGSIGGAGGASRARGGGCDRIRHRVRATIRDIPMHPKSAQDVLAMASLILECLQEEYAPSVIPWSEAQPVWECYSRLHRTSLCILECLFFLLFFAYGVCVIYISIFLHTLMYRDIGKLVPLHPHILAPPAAASWGS
jgi:hypothetical protein